MTASSTTLDETGRAVMYYMFGLVVQTFFFGAYTILIWLSTRMLLYNFLCFWMVARWLTAFRRERKLKTRVNQVMFGITAFMYLFSVAFWAYSIADGVDRMHQYIALAIHPFRPIPDHTAVTEWSPVFNAVTLINYVLSDGVVVWRAWIICVRNHRKYLWITIGFLAVTAITVLLTIIFRIAAFVVSPIKNLPDDSFYPHVIDLLQVTTLVTSLLSNLSATGVVGATAWRHWRTIRPSLASKTSGLRTNRILLLVVETGAIYCISAIMVLISALIRLPHGTLGDLWTPIQVQFAGAYPCIVLLLVSTKKSLSESSFANDEVSSSTSTQATRFGSTDIPKSIHFARNPAMSDTDTIMDISSSRPSTEKFGRPTRLSDDSFV